MSPFPRSRAKVSMAHFAEFFDRKKTFRPKKRFQPGTVRYTLHRRAETSLLAGQDLERAVALPDGQAREDWIAVHAVDFFNRANLIFATVYDSCTREGCPKMSGGTRYEYYWIDGKRFKKATAMPASQYMELVLEWVESTLNDETKFPTFTDVPFPKTFMSTARKIYARLFRIFVHIFLHHYDTLVYLNAEVPVIMCYRHFYYFVQEFQLISSKELAPLADFSMKLCRRQQPTETEKTSSSPSSSLSGSTSAATAAVTSDRKASTSSYRYL